MSEYRKIRVETNASFVLEAQWEEGTVTYPLSDCVFAVKVLEDGDVLISGSVDDGKITIDGDVATIVIEPGDMADLSFYGAAYYDVVGVRTSDGRSKRLLEGPAIVTRGVSSVA